MEAFRKLRARSKSKGQADASSAVTDATPPKRSRPSVWSRHNKLLSRSKSRLSESSSIRGPDEFKRVATSTEPRDPSTNGRIQPVLVGISRPSMTQSRPDTATSIQDAVDRAADLHTQSQPRSPQYSQRSSHSRTKSPKYIDIFAISGQTAKPTTTFNEDVAERNLETLKLTLEERQHRYIPTSKYQEEVASRNLRSFEIPRESHSALASHTTAARNGSLRSSSRRTEISPNSTYQEPRRLDLTEPDQNSEPPAHYSRNYGPRGKEQKKHLSVIPQERASEDGADVGVQNEVAFTGQNMEKENEKTKRLQPGDRSDDRYTTEPAKVTNRLMAAAPLYGHDGSDERQVTMESADTARNQNLRPGYAPDYQQRANEYQRSVNTTRTKSRDSDRPMEEIVYRTTSALSNTSSRRNQAMTGRTIMDLTGDDSDMFSIQSVDYPSTPLIEDATVDPLQKLKPAIVDAAPRSARQSRNLEALKSGKDELSGTSDSFAAGTTHDSAESPKLSSEYLDRNISPLSINSDGLPTGEPRLNFSPISTLASTAPRSSMVIAEPSENKVMSVPTAPVTSSRQEILSPRLDANVLQPIKEDESTSGDTTPIQTPRTTPAPVNDEDTGNHDSDKVPSLYVDELQSSPTSASTVETLVSSLTAAQMSPSYAKIPSLQETDITDTSKDSLDVNGIRSRDFAFVPARGTHQQSSRTHADASDTQKHQTSRTVNGTTGKDNQGKTSLAAKESSKVKQNSGAPRKPRPVSVFDEEGFSKKKEEMKAVLLRLQQSLAEELPPLTDITATNHENARNGLQDSKTSTGGKPISILTKERTKDAGQSKTVQIAGRTTDGRPFPPRTRSLPKGERNDDINGDVFDMEFRPSAVASSSRSPGKKDNSYSRSKYASRNTTTNRPTVLDESSVDKQSAYINPYLARVDAEDVPPHSPGEVSLSSFPLPVTESPSETHMRKQSGSGSMHFMNAAPSLVRRGSQASKMSSASQHSIPFHLVPGRGSSLRDRIQEEQGQIQWD